MPVLTEIAFRGLEADPRIEDLVHRKVAWLEQFAPRIMGCRVVVEPSHQRHTSGNLYHVRVDVTLLGGEVVVRRDPAEAHAHESLRVAIRDAFDAARRRVEDHVRERRGRVKRHAHHPRARVARVFRDEGYGFLETADGREVYFHRNAVRGQPFEELETGVLVRFVEEHGEQGAQATVVRPSRRKVSPPL